MNGNIETIAEKLFLGQGNLLAGQGKLEEAMICFEKALLLNPASFLANFCMGKVIGLLGDGKRAVEYYQAALTIKPNSIQALRGLYHEARKICQWEGLVDIDSKLSFLIKEALDNGREPEEMPYESIIRTDDKELNLRTARWWNRYIHQKLSLMSPALTFNHQRQKGRKIKIGYLSADFREHPVMRLLVDVFLFHNRKKFEVYAYSFGYNDGSYYRKKVEADCDKFVDLVNMEVVERAKIIYEDKIDILVDLMGFTGDAKPEVLALRPAPIQISYLGFPGSTGTDFLDYILTDKILTPVIDQKLYSEKFLYINPCYQINSQINISKKKKNRKDFGLPEKGFVFCSFNATHKIEPVMFGVWMRILKRVPGSVLWVYADNELAKKNLIKEAKIQGVSEKRMIFVKKKPYPEYLAQLKLADLALDTRIYCGGATTSDMLRMNVPVITLYGKHYLSRMSSSLLMAMKLPELLTKNLFEYEELAVELASNSKKWKLLIEKLKQSKNDNVLSNIELFVGKLEKSYEKIYKYHFEGKN